MSRPVVKFNTQDNPEFFSVLRKRVNQHFKDKNISKHANNEMKFKTAFMLGLYFIPMGLMYFQVFTSSAAIFGLWAIMGFGMAGIGLSIMHDANHGAYSKSKKVNQTLGFLINFLGAYHSNWIIQHNVLHHSYTNIEDHDEDIKNPVMRFSPGQKRKKGYKYQVFYAPFLYAIMTLYWFISKDFERVFTYDDKKLLGTQNLTKNKALAIIAAHKIWYILLTLIIPMFIVPIPWWHMIIGFLLMHGITGISLALIFQPAHVICETNFYKIDSKNSVENNWAIHQLNTTSNFANNARIFSWFVGGLNNQVEHHLFPKICHVHYRDLSPIVKKTALEFGIPYHQHKTFWGAVYSHFSMLNQLGTGSYDTNLAQKAA